MKTGLTLLLTTMVIFLPGCPELKNLSEKISKLFAWQGLIVADGGTEHAAKPEKIIEKPVQKEEFVVKAKKPYETTKPIFLRATPEKIIQEEGWITESQIPKEEWPSLRKITLGIDPVSPVDKNTFEKLQKIIKPEQVLFRTEDWTPMYIKGRSGAPVAAMIPPGTILLCNESYGKSGQQILTPVLIPYCWNSVGGTKFVKMDRLLMQEKFMLSTERYLDEKTVVRKIETIERFRDIKREIDYTPALWIGLAALMIGGAIGWLARLGGIK